MTPPGPEGRTAQTCRTCGAPLEPAVAGEHCPRCLLQAALQPDAALRVRCPHCHEPVEFVAETAELELTCRSCQSRFSLVDHSAAGYQPLQGQRFGRFELLSQLGAGAFGTVWKARDTELDRVVAVKLPRYSQVTPQHTAQFLREARAAAQVRAAGLVSVHEVGVHQGRVYIVSDFIDGHDLADWLEDHALTHRESAALCLRIATAIDAAHQAGVVHRDLKPSNILIDEQGQPHITDFGLAKREAGEITMTWDGRILGTPAYMSPEQARGASHEVDRRSDVYSLGVILFELLTGERPFRGESQMLLHQVLHDEPPMLRKLSAAIPFDLEVICLHCLRKEPQARYATASDLAADLQRFLDGRPILARPVTRGERAWRWVRRNPIVATLAATTTGSLLAAAVIALLFGWWARLEATDARQARAAARVQAIRATQQLALSKRDEALALRHSSIGGRQAKAVHSLRAAVENLSAAQTLLASATSAPESVREAQRDLESQIPATLRDEALFWLTSYSVHSLGSVDFSQIVEQQPGLAGDGRQLDWSPVQLATAPNGRWLAVEQPLPGQGGYELLVVDTASRAVKFRLPRAHRRGAAGFTMQHLLGLAPTADSSRLWVARAESQPGRRTPRGMPLPKFILELVDVETGKVTQQRRMDVPDKVVSPTESTRWTALFSPDCARVLICSQPRDPRGGAGSRGASRVALAFATATGSPLGALRSDRFIPYRILASGREVLGVEVTNGRGYGSSPTVAGLARYPLSGEAATRLWKSEELRLTPFSGVSNSPGLGERTQFWPRGAWLSPDERIAAGWVDVNGGQILLVDLVEGRPIAWVPLQGQARERGPAVFTPDGRELLVALHNAVHVISIPEGRLVHSHRFANRPVTRPRYPSAPRPREPMELRMLGNDRIVIHFHHRVTANHFAPADVEAPPRYGDEFEIFDLGRAVVAPPKRFRHEAPLETATLSANAERVYFAPRPPAAIPGAPRTSTWPPHVGDALVAMNVRAPADRQRPVMNYSPESAPGAGVQPTHTSRLWRIPQASSLSWRTCGFDRTGTVVIEPPPMAADLVRQQSWAVRRAGDGSLIRDLSQFQFAHASESRRYYVLRKPGEDANQTVRGNAEPRPHAAHQPTGAAQAQAAVQAGIYLLDTLENRLVQLTASTEYIPADQLYFSPGENYLIVQLERDGVRILRTADGQTVATLEASAFNSRGVRFAAEERQVLVPLRAGQEVQAHQCVLVDLPSGDLAHRFPHTRGFPVTTADLSAVAWSEPPDVRRGPQQPPRGAIRVWLRETNLVSLLTESTELSADGQLWLSADGTRLLISHLQSSGPSTGQRVLELWDTSERRRLFTTQGLGGSVSEVHVSDVYPTFAVSYQPAVNNNSDLRLEIRRFADGDSVAAFESARARQSVHEGRWLVVSHAGKQQQLVSMKDGSEVLPRNGTVVRQDLLDETSRRWLITAGDDGTVVLRDVESRRDTPIPVTPAELLAISPDGRRLASYRRGQGATVRVWDTDSGKQLASVTPSVTAWDGPSTGPRITGARFSADGLRLIVEANLHVRVLDLEQQRVRYTFPRRGHSGPVRGLALGWDSQLVVSGSADQTVGFWSVEGRSLGLLEGFRRGVTAVRLLPDSSHLLVMDEGGELTGWHLTKEPGRVTGKFAWRYAARKGADVAVFPDENWLATIAGDSGRIAIVDAGTGKALRLCEGEAQGTLAGGPQRRVTGMKLNGQLAQWDVASGKLLATSRTPVAGPLRGLASAPDGTVATVGQAVQLWTTELAPALTLPTAAGRPLAAGWSLDGSSLAVVEDNQSLVVYNIGELRKRLEELGLNW